MIRKRVEKAEHELSYSWLFDLIIINDQLEVAFKEAEEKILAFIGN
jgi:guanylate kinase